MEVVTMLVSDKEELLKMPNNRIFLKKTKLNRTFT